MIIDATNLIVGRMATYAAKKALLGEDVRIVNCDKAVMTGKRESVLEKYKRQSQMGRHSKGPFYRRRSDMFVRRIVRGMLPYKQEKGINALKRVMCYVGVPDELKDKKLETFKDAHVSKVPSLYYTSVNEIVKSLGGKR